MIWVKAKVMSSVLQGETKPFRHNTCPEAPVVTVDKGACVSKSVRDAQVDCSGGGNRRAAFRVDHRAFSINQFPSFICVLFRQQLFEGDIRKRWVGHIPARICKGEAHDFDHEMETLSRKRGKRA